MDTLSINSKEMSQTATDQDRRARGWQQWVPYATVVWSLMYGVLGILWAVSGRGFPYNGEVNPLGPLMGRFGSVVEWVLVALAGLPAAGMGLAMLRGARGKVVRPLFITAGGLLAASLLLLMIGLDLLIQVGYIPYTIKSLLIGDGIGQKYLAGWTQWSTLHELLCMVGGFLWLGATVVYTRRSGETCLVCGRGEAPEGWTSPERAARWGRAAVFAGLVAPVFYAFTRYAWALGWPLGMSREYWQQGQEKGLWVAGLFLATFGLVGGLLMLGLVQRWGERFPRWMIGLAGRRVPIAMAVIPAALASVLIGVGGIGIVADTTQMMANMDAAGVKGAELIGALVFQLGPALLFPLWGAALAMGTLGYYFRRRGPCKACGRGGSH